MGAVSGANIYHQTCPACETTLAQFRSSSLLGCEECYRAFESQLSPLIQRAHEGATHHTGKTPRLHATGHATADMATRIALAEERAKRQQTLRKQLADAVAAEQYERAARLRDELQRVDSGGGAARIDPLSQSPGDGGEGGAGTHE